MCSDGPRSRRLRRKCAGGQGVVEAYIEFRSVRLSRKKIMGLLSLYVMRGVSRLVKDYKRVIVLRMI
ncbi:hypothetical protein CS542_10360 [Pedobacter sp. IW39]|nr:hypothetical protein CS542_10360 [Pedobacter sp. IW39]